MPNILHKERNSLMVKKSYFMRTFNLNINLILVSFLAGFIGWSLDFLSNQFKLNPLSFFDFSPINGYLYLGSKYSYTAMSFLLLTLFVSVMFEILNRFRFDSLFNYFKRSEELRVGKGCRSRWWRYH